MSKRGAGVQFSGAVQRWQQRWVQAPNTPIPVFKWVPLGPDTRTADEKLAGRRKYVPLRIEGTVELEGLLPLPAAGLAAEKPAPALEHLQEAPRRSLRPRTERAYVEEFDGGGDDDFNDSEGGAATPTQRT